MKNRRTIHCSWPGVASTLFKSTVFLSSVFDMMVRGCSFTVKIISPPLSTSMPLLGCLQIPDFMQIVHFQWKCFGYLWLGKTFILVIRMLFLSDLLRLFMISCTNPPSLRMPFVKAGKIPMWAAVTRNLLLLVNLIPSAIEFKFSLG